MAPLLYVRRLGAYAGSGGGVIIPPDPDPGGGGGEIPDNLPLLQAISADAIIDSMGVNLHSTYTGWAYKVAPAPASGFATSGEAIRESAAYAGIRHFRDNITYNNAGQRALVAEYLAGTSNTVFFSSWNLNNGPSSYTAAQLLADIQAHYPKCDGIEGYNESDIARYGGTKVSNWVALTRAYQQSLYSTFNPAGYRVISPPLAFTDASHGSAAALGSVSSWADVAALHVYPGARIPSYGVTKAIGESAQNVSASKPRWNTECGYHNGVNGIDTHASASEYVAGVYAPIEVLSDFLLGFARSYFYELVDDRRNDARDDKEKNFGLFGWDASAAPSWRRKPAAVSLHNLSLLLSDPGAAFTPAPVKVAVDGPADMRYMLLGKRDGTYQLCIWREVSIWTPPISRVAKSSDNLTPASQTVTVTFDRSRTVKRFQPDSSSISQSERTDVVHTASIAGSLQVLTF